MNNFEWVALAIDKDAKAPRSNVYVDDEIMMASNDVLVRWAPAVFQKGVYQLDGNLLHRFTEWDEDYINKFHNTIPKNPISKFKLTSDLMKREGDSTFISPPRLFKSVRINDSEPAEFNLEPLVLEFDNHYLDAILSGEDEFPDAECDNSRDGLVIKHRNGRCAMILPKHYPCNP